MGERDIGVFPVSWPDQAGEWRYHLSLPGCDGIQSGGTYGEMEMIARQAGGEWPARLLVRPDPEGIRCAVACDGGEASEDEVRRWREAVAKAANELGRHDELAGAASRQALS